MHLAGAADLLDVEPEAAPAAADVEHAAVRLDEQLGRNQPLLGQLRFLQRAVGPLEVGAAVLLVGIEEQLVEPTVEIVVVGDVAARAPGIVAADDAARKEAAACRACAQEASALRLGVAQHELEEIVDGAALDDEAAVHEQLAQAQLGIDDRGALGTRIHEADADLLAGAVAEGVLTAARRHDRQRTALDEPRQDCRQYSFHGSTTAQASQRNAAPAAGASRGDLRN